MRRAQKIPKRKPSVSQIALEDIQARQEGPDKKTWHRHDIKGEPFRPTPKQLHCRDLWAGGAHVLAMLGTAGTAKTYTAVRIACEAYTDPEERISNICIIRSPIQSVEQGHLPGNEAEKAAPFERPYPELFATVFGRPNTYRDMKRAGAVSFETVSFLRGTTMNDTIVILDEVQNCTFDQIHTVITRLGRNSRLLITGDTRQKDLSARYNVVSGIGEFGAVARKMEGLKIVQFFKEDVVRGPIAKAWIEACEEHWGTTESEEVECSA